MKNAIGLVGVPIAFFIITHYALKYSLYLSSFRDCEVNSEFSLSKDERTTSVIVSKEQL